MVESNLKAQYSTKAFVSTKQYFMNGCLCSASDMAQHLYIVVSPSSLKNKIFSYQLLCSVARQRVLWRECQRSGNNFQTRKYFSAYFHARAQRTMKMKLRKVMDDACVGSRAEKFQGFRR